AHSRAVVHRDLKPSNIMLGGYGEVLVMDWGLAKILKKAASAGQKIRSHREDLGRMATRQGEAIGTPGYMPPELALGQLHLVDERSDVFSLGAILYEMLTLTRPYSGRDAQTILRKMLKGAVTPARERAPKRNIPLDLEAICARCLSRDVSKRYGSVLELHGAIQRHLEERAELIDSGPWEEKGELEDHVRGYLELASRERSLRQEVQSREGRMAPWEPVEARRSLRNRQAKLADCQADLARRFTFAVDYLRGRLSRDPADVVARQSLGQIAREEFIRSEDIGDVGIFGRCKRILSALDVHGDMLRGHGRVIVETDVPGIDAWLYHVTEVDSVLTPVRRQSVGPTPFECLDLAMGAYLLHLRTSGGRHVRVPFRIRRQQNVKIRVDMARAGRAQEGFVYIPPGQADIGGDSDAQWPLSKHTLEHGDFLLSRLQVTCREYLRFLNALARSDLASARAHAPRRADGGGPLFRELDGTFFIPRRPFMGLTWDPNWPVFGISQTDALAYCRWRSQRDGIEFRLPTDLEWEAAARGGDGRLYPWGNAWESAFCNSGLSHAGQPRLEPVGSHPTDLSPYGVMDLAGGVADWTSTVLGTKSSQGDELVVCRGGSWIGFDRQARCASRVVDVASGVSLGRGFRLAIDAG
ncbi:MAG: bifunctional serine/threonine-protein kinase/formylglycine-generating enzyme family protein, partial [Myxococcota bacterium]|nr:bifunctional serine/threonine-protein kinase/formylglycine-generating enzyme family protein [Myxococcota bacterium]